MEEHKYSVNQDGVRRTVLLGLAALALYLFLTGKMPFEGWLLLGAAFVVSFRLIRGVPKGSCLRINAEGVCDTRLNIGVVRWEDIKRPYLRKTNGVPFLCLELKNPADYRARIPASQRLAFALYRLQGMKHIVITTSHLDEDAETILARVRAGCAHAGE